MISPGRPQVLKCQGTMKVVVEKDTPQTTECRGQHKKERCVMGGLLMFFLIMIAMSQVESKKYKKIRTLQSNLFYKWLEFSAKHVSHRDSIACYNTKRIPKVQPLPESQLNMCTNLYRCFAYCAMEMAAEKQKWNSSHTVCPRWLNSGVNDSELKAPSLILKAVDLTFPFCIVRGQTIERLVNRHTPIVKDPNNLLVCSKAEWYPKLGGSDKNITMNIKWCVTTPQARVKCSQVIPDGGDIVYEKNQSHISQYQLRGFANGTVPLGDIFWVCEKEAQLLVRLPKDWKGLCAPLMLTGPLTILTLYEEPQKSLHHLAAKQEKGQDEWQEDERVYVSFDQKPFGLPSESKAMEDDRLISEPVAGSMPIGGSLIDTLNVAHNSCWVNYLWYNQQRFIDHMVLTLGTLKEQLHTTSVTALQSRFDQEKLIAQNQVICEEIAEECCMVIPLNSNTRGNLTDVLNKMKLLHDEHVKHSKKKTKPSASWNMLQRMSQSKIIKAIAIAIGGLLLLVAVTPCCMFLLVCVLIKKMKAITTSQFLLRSETVNAIDNLDYVEMNQIKSEHIYEN